MPYQFRLRKHRQSLADHWYAVTFRTWKHSLWFLDSQLAPEVIKIFVNVDHQRTIALVVMPDHIHWLFQLKGAFGMAKVLQAGKSISAICVNRCLSRCGPVWQKGYYDHKIRNIPDLRHQAQYLLDNPVRSGLADRWDEYPFHYADWNGVVGR